MQPLNPSPQPGAAGHPDDHSKLHALYNVIAGAADGKMFIKQDGLLVPVDVPEPGGEGGEVPSPHALGGVHHSSATLADLNAKISDAELDAAGTARPPTAHAHDYADSGHGHGVAAVTDGGTGRSTLTSGAFLRGNGASAVTMSTVAQSLTALGLISGSNANGRFLRIPPGMLICAIDNITLTRVTNDAVAATWTFPQVFGAPPAVVMTPIGALGGSAPALNQMSITRAATVSTTETLLQIWRQAGATNWAVDSTWASGAVAIGLDS